MIIIDNINTLQDEGVWAEFGGSKFKIAHSSNLLFQRTLNRLQLPHRRQIERGNLDPATGLSILCKSLAKGVLLDWRDVQTSNGTTVDFSEEMAEQALKNNPDLREFVQDFSSDLDNFRSERIKSEGKS